MMQFTYEIHDSVEFDDIDASCLYMYKCRCWKTSTLTITFDGDFKQIKQLKLIYM